MDKLKSLCEEFGYVFRKLNENDMSVPDLKILTALYLHGEMRRSDLMIQAGFICNNQKVLDKLTDARRIDKLKYMRGQGYRYSINHIGLAALKRALGPLAK